MYVMAYIKIIIRNTFSKITKLKYATKLIFGVRRNRFNKYQYRNKFK